MRNNFLSLPTSNFFSTSAFTKLKRFQIFPFLSSNLGKPCPEKSRPHKTRCDTYYKCQDLPPKAHVWIPIKCEEGLVYERNLLLCVLPEDDWECNLGDNNGDIQNQNEVLNVNKIVATKSIPVDMESRDAEIEIVSSEKEDEINFTDDVDSIQLVMDTNLSSEEEENGDNNYESSGDGGEIMELNGFLQAQNKHTNENVIEIDETKEPKSDKTEKEIKETTMPTTSSSYIDPKLTAHLQRLSQLIDGLKQTYQNQDTKQTEMRPDQLNAFLAHFDIKNKFNTLITKGDEDYKQTPISSTTPIPNIVTITETPKNRTDADKTKNIKPETKVVLTSGYSKRYGNNGYSNSQIVVNHPEGSVLFSLPPYGQEQHLIEHPPSEYHSQDSPKISEETLKTVLELSKQMIANQNVPKVIQNPGYYQQPTILQPLYLPAAAFPGVHGNPFANYFNQNNNPNYDDKENRYSYYRPPNVHSHSHSHKKQRPGNGNSYTKPGTTIIHNNVIPVHVTSTNSGEKEVVDSYGQSLGLYPPLNVNDRFENNKFITSLTTMSPSISSTTPASHYAGQYPSPYSTEISVTTIRPFDYRPSPSTVAEFYTPSPHLNENNVNRVYQPSDRYPTVQYNSPPQPIDTNRIISIAQNQPQYQQVERPSQQYQYQQQQSQPQQQYYTPTNLNSLFPSRIDPNKVKIRPNSQKVESMEVGSEEMLSYDEPAEGYNTNNNNEYISPTQYVDSSAVLTIGNSQQKHPYMPRPSSALSSSITISHTPKFPPYGSSSSSGFSSTPPEGTQLVNVGGNFIRYDVFQNSVLPLLGHSPTGSDDLSANIEVITCATGVRQPNNTDCTRYYVCSKKDGKVLSYSCPPYTAFNGQTRICDAHTYSVCTPAAIVNSYTVSENKRIQLEAFQALQDVKRRREQAMKAQSIANLLQQYSGTANMQTSSVESSNSQEKDMLNSYMQQAASLASTATLSNTPKPAKKRKYYCKEGDKIPDQTSINNYFVCYKNAQGMMKGHKMTCTKGLLFCPKTTMCTLPVKCS